MGAGPEEIGTDRADIPTSVWTGDPLCALLDELRGEGFPIGVGEYLEAQEAAAACYRDGLGHQPHRLRNYLAPVLCRSFEQQQIFYRRFDTWWIDCAGGQKEELPSLPLPPPPLHESELGEVARRTRPWKWWAVSALGAAVVVATLVWWSSLVGLWFSQFARGEGVTSPSEPIVDKAEPLSSRAQGGAGVATRIARRATLNIQVVDLSGRPVPRTTARLGYATNQLISTLVGHTAAVRGASFSPDGQRVVSASSDGTARVWAVDGSGAPVVLRGHKGPVQTVAFSPDGSRVVTASTDYTARVWAVDGSGEPVVLRGHKGPVQTVAFSPDGSRVVTASTDYTARIWVVDGSGEPVVLRGHKGEVASAVFSPDGSHVVTASRDWTARVWAVDGFSDPVVLRGPMKVVPTAAFGPDGRRVVAASWDNTARVWAANGFGRRVIFRGHEAPLWSAAFSPDGSRIVTASVDKTARVWAADGSGEPVILRGHEKTALSAAFSPDGSCIVTASRDTTARVWDAVTGKLLGEPLRHQGEVLSASFSPDSQHIVTASADGTARVWSAPVRDVSTLPILGVSNDQGEIDLLWDTALPPPALYFIHPDHHSPALFTFPANRVRGTLEVRLAPLTLWERLFQHQRKIKAGLALLPLVLTGPWLAWRVLRRRQLVLERRTTGEEHKVASPILPEPSHELYRGTGFASARVEVQRRQRTGTEDLDPDATVEATVRRLGFFTPIYRARLELPVYLVLVDRVGIKDQRARMVDEILDRLQAGNVDLVRYDFDRDPRRSSLRFSGGVHRDLEELAGLYPGHRLAVFTDGAGITDPATGRLVPWIRLFSSWPEKILLTPVPPDYWSRRELDLTAAGFVVLPASEAGVERLADTLRREGGAIPRPLEETWSPPYPDLLAARPGRFLERHPPEESELSALCNELAFYLGPDGYRWLCSLALYPKLDWYFTLYMGLLLRRFDGRMVLDETTLLALTRLPWLRHGSMPDWLRLRLLRDLSEDDEKEVREWMRQFLEQRETPGSRFRLDVARPPEPEARGLRERLRRWIESKDWRRLIKDWAHHEPQEGPLRDQIFVSFLLGTKPSRLQVLAPRTWRRWAWKQGLAALGPRTGFVLGLTALVSILGLASGGPGLEWLAGRFSLADRSTVTVVEALQPKAPSETRTILSESNLYLLAIGIGNYRNSILRLAFPAEDARDVTAAWQAQSGRSYQKIETRLLIDEKATREGILAGLRWLERETTENDVAVLFFSGHSEYDSRSGENLFLPWDADLDRRATMISDREVQSILRKIPGKVLLFLDANHDLEKTREASDLNKLIDDLPRAKNSIVVFSASAPGQVTRESPGWRNGAFSRALVEALSSNRADDDRDNSLYITEIERYLLYRVTELTDRLQTPVVFKRSGMPNFPVAVVP